nr:uncharacterized protein LOC113816167 [Penaeus vannamei]
MSPGACDIACFLIQPAKALQELYLLVRSHGINHTFVVRLLEINPLSKLKILIADAPRRTLAAPMLELTFETAYLVINNCPSIQLLGNLICWSVTSTQVAELRAVIRMCNYNLTVIHTQSNKLNNKHF